MFCRSVSLILALAALVHGSSLAAGGVPATADASADPFRTGIWTELERRFLTSGKAVFDDRVKVVAPTTAEDSLNVPVSVRTDGLEGVQRVVVLADYNPIIKVLEYEPLAGPVAVSFRMKLQQASPVRAAARTADGVWHVGGVWVDATGGGCTLPSTGRGQANWTETLGQVQSRAWQTKEGTRLRLRVMHPMDTGLAPGIPAFYIERLVVQDEAGKEYLRIATFEPISENPVFSLDFPGSIKPRGKLLLTGSDNNGNRVRAVLP